ncbi:DUF937 domain-containing protein [Deinococcus wulumuqiensis]|uniref:DUF937 domain-containing protein n=1 Tax=Deinococcus wulumuqiensis TaxID=980427 RepID=A0AAV4K5F6_9DEIO|nr:DUF937 domain-containing protein [Deinococcus wulumuqiensis]QII21400.1 DUF937 domain-containing protein [Deinococcus wulumuqiensis R12]GGI82776.1 hypothetical protein GCM10010914_16290 [Deinococcus wulumuqiensis]GGP29496.1 hypothetical protein GCM10008021_11470 [Deinococcus wulumuqiensis]
MRDIIQSYFSPEAVSQLGQVAGLDATLTQRALSLGLPLQLDALAAHASTPEGRTQLGEALSNLPHFGSVSEALSAPSGALNLQQAGGLLAPTLLGGQADDIVQQVTRRVGGSVGGVQKVLHMALPLLLSLLGRQGMNASTAESMLGSLRGGLGDLDLGGLATGGLAAGGLAASGLAGGAGAVATGLDAGQVPPPPPSGLGNGVTAAQLAPGAVTPTSLLETIQAEFSGENADRIGRAAGFSGATAGKAVLGALPVVLSALIGRGRTEAGAAELLNNSQELERLTGTDGRLNASLLSDSAEMARLEGQGRGVLGQLYGNVDALTGRLGTALGGSGANAGRLLSLLTPLVLGLLGRTARTSRMSPVVLSGLLGAMQDKLPGLIPAGMGGLAALLGTGTAQAQNAQAQTSETVVASTTPRVVENVAAAKPVTPAAPVVTPPVTTATTTSAPVPERRGGIPWWVWLLPLLLLGGCWFVNNQNRTTTTTTTSTAAQQDGGIIVSNPQSDSNLPAQPFTMSGTAAPNMQLKIEDEGQTVAEATADADGNWTAEIPAPTVGEHTYSIIGGEGAKSEFKVNVTDENAEGSTDATGTDTSDTDSTGTDGAAAGDFTVTEPAQNADVAATGFNLTGTGTPGETYELLEDGVSVGTFTVGDDGNWTADVAAPSEGDKTYTIQDGSGNEVATLPVKVGAGTADAGQCSQDLSVSLEDGETVSAPFRFGGVGSSDSYTVTIRRADRVIGTKKIPLGAGCTWSYSSNPGGRSGTVNDVTYEVRASGTAASAPADATLNLKVRAR